MSDLEDLLDFFFYWSIQIRMLSGKPVF